MPGAVASIMNKESVMELEDQLMEERMKEEEGHPMGPESRWPAELYRQNGMCADRAVLCIFYQLRGGLVPIPGSS